MGRGFNHNYNKFLLKNLDVLAIFEQLLQSIALNSLIVGEYCYYAKSQSCAESSVLNSLVMSYCSSFDVNILGHFYQFYADMEVWVLGLLQPGLITKKHNTISLAGW